MAHLRNGQLSPHIEIAGLGGGVINLPRVLMEIIERGSVANSAFGVLLAFKPVSVRFAPTVSQT